VRHPAGADPRASLDRAAQIRAQQLLLSQVALSVRQEHSFEARARELVGVLNC
jgi:hypothetical protein